MKFNKMKGGSTMSRSFRYGSVSTILSIVLIASIVLVNIIFSMLAQKFNWYYDMTSKKLFSLSDECLASLNGVSEDVTIYFCDHRDNLEADLYQSYILHTALELADKMPNIHVEYLDIWSNPTSVDRFKRGESDPIYSHSVIVESGTEWRTYQMRAFFTFNDSTESTPWAYSGEKVFSSAILAVTKAESPIACIPQNHGEMIDPALVNLLAMSGYDVQPIDLLAEEIPADCRLLVIYNPVSDFVSDFGGISDKSEIKKIDKFLNGLNAMMVFLNPDNPELPVLEEYLEEWGIDFIRHTNELDVTTSCKVIDSMQSLTQDGLTILGEYVTAGLGASIHKNMRSGGVPPKIVFKNVMPIRYSDSYKISSYLPEDVEETSESSGVHFTYGSYSSSANVSRDIYDVFTSHSSAKLFSGGAEVGSATEIDKYRLMTVTREQRMIDNTNADSSYVWACGSIDFARTEFLNSNTFGNADLLMYSLHTMGKEFVPVEIKFKIFDNTTIEGLTTAQADQYTWTLILVPAIVMFAAGVIVIVRRKYS